MSFARFSIDKRLVGALESLGYKEPSPIQEKVIPGALRGESMLVQAPTGSGKTHSFLIPIIARTDFDLPRPQAVIVAPSRELARQTYEFCRAFARFYPKMRVRLWSSETDVSQNEEGKSLPPQIVVGTPGRLVDLLVQRDDYPLTNVRTLVLDEADMLFEEGCGDDVKSLADRLGAGQALVYSATLKPHLVAELKKDFPGIDFEGTKEVTPGGLSHHLVDIKHVGKARALVDFMKARRPYLCLAFSSKKEDMKPVADLLRNEGIDYVYFSGALSERDRKKAIREIRSGKHALVLTSDLLARGIDLAGVSDVVSLDVPPEIEFYSHRAGRAARFGEKGDSWAFYNSDTVADARRLLAEGIPFDYYVLKGGELLSDPTSLEKKARGPKKKALPEEEVKEIKIAKALTRKKRVEPMHRKKTQFAIEKVKRKYRRKAIKASIRAEIGRSYAMKAKNKKK